MRLEHDDLVRGSASHSGIVCCANCGGKYFEIDIHEGERMCVGCGMVDCNFAMFIPEVEHYAQTSTLFKRKAVYDRLYHMHERVAQFLCTGPKAPLYVVQAVLAEVVRRRISKPVRVDAQFVKRVCTEIGAGKYAERWIWIRREVLRIRGLSTGQVVVRDLELAAILADFKSASTAFDALLYRTRSGGAPCGPSGRPYSHLARHNVSWF